MEYRRLNASLEPLQTCYGKANGEKYAEGQDNDDVAVPRVNAELENRPSVEELVARYDVPTVQYKTRRVGGAEDGPPFMKIPVSGDVAVIGFRKNLVIDCMAARSLPCLDQNQRDAFVRRTMKPERLNIKVEMSGLLEQGQHQWAPIYQIGGLRFESYGTKYRKRGQLTHYVDSKNPNRWHRVKEDVAGTPYAAGFLGSANQKDERDMARKGWAG